MFCPFLYIFRRGARAAPETETQEYWYYSVPALQPCRRHDRGSAAMTGAIPVAETGDMHEVF
jgi:hypothetical protein